MNKVDIVIKNAEVFYSELKNDINCRYRSWEYCYYDFYKARKDENRDLDYLSLQLAFYLASWGMYRGSSFLLHKDYKVHTPVVKKVLDKKYDALFGIKCEHLLLEKNQKLLTELSDFICTYYGEIRCDVKGIDIKTRVSETLVTKILMGTMGCVPAYDRYFVAGIKAHKIASGSYKVNKSILQLVEFYQKNFEQLESVRNKMFIEDVQYPQMKLLDMGLWQIGYEIETA